MSGITRLTKPVKILQTTFTTNAILQHNVQARFEASVPGVVAAKVHSVTLRHQISEGVEVHSSSQQDGLVEIFITNRTGSDLAAGQVFNILVRQ